jgi:putative FmdB family regulatory protein
MPIYAYKCESCGFGKDVLQKMSDPLLTRCPACGAETFRKQVTAAGFQLKGSGWYVTDFRGGDTAKPAAASDQAAAPAADAAPSKDAAAPAPAPAPAAAPAAASPAPSPAPAPAASAPKAG